MYLLTLKESKDEGAYAVKDKYGEKVLFLFEEEDDAIRYAMMLEDQEDQILWENEYYLIESPLSHDDARNFTMCDDNYCDNASWAIFGNAHGGNCCEHYLAATKEGWILNFGGEYPTWSEDRGHTWNEYRPSIFSQIGCLEPKPTVPGQEGLADLLLQKLVHKNVHLDNLPIQ